MRLISNFKKFVSLPFKEKKLLIEAFFMLGLMRLAILGVSFKWLTRSLIPVEDWGVPVKLPIEQRRMALTIGKAIVRAARYTPWESACLAQSLAAQRMLKRRGIPGVFYLGVMKGETEDGKLNAHAWTQCGGEIITGKGGHENFTVMFARKW